METAKRTAILLILALLAMTMAQSVDAMVQDERSPASKIQISQTRTANCLVKVTADPSAVPLNMQTIHYLLESSAVAGNAAREVLGIASLQGPRPFEITIEQLTGPDGGYGGGVGLPGTTSRRSSSRSRASQPGYQQTAKLPEGPMTMRTGPRVEGILGDKALISGRWRKVGDNIGDAKVLEVKPTHVKVEWQGQQKTLFPVGARTTSRSSARPSSNQQTSYGYSSRAKTGTTPTQPKPKATLGAATSRYSSTSDPLSTQTPYGSSSRSGDAYGNIAFPGGYYESLYGRGSSTSTGDPYNVGSASRYSSSYSRTAARSPTTRTTSRYSAAARPASAAQTIFFHLQVDIPEESAKPAAKEFMNALIANLRDVLEFAAGEYGMSIQDELKFAERDRDEANAQLVKTMAEAQPEVSNPTVETDIVNVVVKKQLDETVDLSALTPEMAFSEAIDEIRNSVDPPLTIVVLWRDIYDNAEIEPTTETNLEGIRKIRVRNALDLLLKSVAGSFSDGLGYSIDDGVITIATEYSIPRDMITVVYEVPGLIYSGSTTMELADVIIRTIEPDSWFENEDGSGEGKITPYLGNKLAVLQTVDVHNKIKRFLEDTAENNAPLAIPPDIPPETFLYEKQELQRVKRMLEMDVARFKARRTAIEQAVAKISVDVAQKLDADPVTAELEKILKINATLLAATKKRYESGTISGAEIQQVEEKLARARIELARRREELSKAAGGAELAKFNSELISLAIDLAEKTAELQVLNTQLGQTESQLAMATTLNTQLSELRYAKEAFDAAQRRISQLKARLANLVPPTVTVIGAY
ncbi:MAG: hypothetical protein ISS79_02560 [Phycisphaerae bacterium]|nr:hypothetical protein [Phycisphaerae bacterium]